MIRAYQSAVANRPKKALIRLSKSNALNYIPSVFFKKKTNSETRNRLIRILFGTYQNHFLPFNDVIWVHIFAFQYDNRNTWFASFQYNPFRQRLAYVFSSRKDDCLSFDDFVDLASVMSISWSTHISLYYILFFPFFQAFCEKAPANVRAAFAFRIYGNTEMSEPIRF